jgi:hypothetical protein
MCAYSGLSRRTRSLTEVDRSLEIGRLVEGLEAHISVFVIAKNRVFAQRILQTDALSRVASFLARIILEFCKEARKVIVGRSL